MNPKLMSYGIAAAVTITILKIVFDFVKSMAVAKKEVPVNTVKCSGSKEVIEILGLVKKLWEIHNKYNEDGAPKWYFPASALKGIQDELKKIKDKLP